MRIRSLTDTIFFPFNLKMDPLHLARSQSLVTHTRVAFYIYQCISSFILNRDFRNLIKIFFIFLLLLLIFFNFFYFQSAGEKAIDLTDIWKPRANKSTGGPLTSVPPHAAITSFKKWRKGHHSSSDNNTNIKHNSNEDEMNLLKFLALVSQS